MLEFKDFPFYKKKIRVELKRSFYATPPMRLAVVFMDYSEGYPQPGGNLTVHLPDDLQTNNRCAYLDTNNYPELVTWLLSHHLGRLTGIAALSGFCSYPEFEFSPEAIKKMDEK